MPRKQVITPEKIKGQLAKIALKLEKGEIEPKVANSIATVWGKCLYAIQVETSTESVKENLERLEILEDALATGDTSKLAKLIEKRGETDEL